MSASGRADEGRTFRAVVVVVVLMVAPWWARCVGGHEILNADGQVSERWRPVELNVGGHRICPTRS
jgi:hypothetical protein